MAGSVNMAILVGNLGRDPEVFNTADGKAIVNLSIATSDQWRDKATGEKRERTEWHRVVIFNERICEVAAKYLTKGAKVFIQGEIRTRKWTDQHGTERYSTEIVLPNFGGRLDMLGGGRRGDDPDAGERPASSGGKPPSGSGAPDFDGEIPF
jgi:single-strand DNA-binding protein